MGGFLKKSDSKKEIGMDFIPIQIYDVNNRQYEEVLLAGKTGVGEQAAGDVSFFQVKSVVICSSLYDENG